MIPVTGAGKQAALRKKQQKRSAARRCFLCTACIALLACAAVASVHYGVALHFKQRKEGDRQASLGQQARLSTADGEYLQTDGFSEDELSGVDAAGYVARAAGQTGTDDAFSSLTAASAIHSDASSNEDNADEGEDVWGDVSLPSTPPIPSQFPINDGAPATVSSLGSPGSALDTPPRGATPGATFGQGQGRSDPGVEATYEDDKEGASMHDDDGMLWQGGARVQLPQHEKIQGLGTGRGGGGGSDNPAAVTPADGVVLASGGAGSAFDPSQVQDPTSSTPSLRFGLGGISRDPGLTDPIRGGDGDGSSPAGGLPSALSSGAGVGNALANAGGALPLTDASSEAAQLTVRELLPGVAAAGGQRTGFGGDRDGRGRAFEGNDRDDDGDDDDDDGHDGHDGDGGDEGGDHDGDNGGENSDDGAGGTFDIPSDRVAGRRQGGASQGDSWRGVIGMGMSAGGQDGLSSDKWADVGRTGDNSSASAALPLPGVSGDSTRGDPSTHEDSSSGGRGSWADWFKHLVHLKGRMDDGSNAGGHGGSGGSEVASSSGGGSSGHIGDVDSGHDIADASGGSGYSDRGSGDNDRDRSGGGSGGSGGIGRDGSQNGGRINDGGDDDLGGEWGDVDVAGGGDAGASDGQGNVNASDDADDNGNDDDDVDDGDYDSRRREGRAEGARKGRIGGGDGGAGAADGFGDSRDGATRTDIARLPLPSTVTANLDAAAMSLLTGVGVQQGQGLGQGQGLWQGQGQGQGQGLGQGGLQWASEQRPRSVWDVSGRGDASGSVGGGVNSESNSNGGFSGGSGSHAFSSNGGGNRNGGGGEMGRPLGFEARPGLFDVGGMSTAGSSSVTGTQALLSSRGASDGADDAGGGDDAWDTANDADAWMGEEEMDRARDRARGGLQLPGQASAARGAGFGVSARPLDRFGAQGGAAAAIDGGARGGMFQGAATGGFPRPDGTQLGSLSSLASGGQMAGQGGRSIGTGQANRFQIDAQSQSAQEASSFSTQAASLQGGASREGIVQWASGGMQGGVGPWQGQGMGAGDGSSRHGGFGGGMVGDSGQDAREAGTGGATGGSGQGMLGGAGGNQGMGGVGQTQPEVTDASTGFDPGKGGDVFSQLLDTLVQRARARNREEETTAAASVGKDAGVGATRGGPQGRGLGMGGMEDPEEEAEDEGEEELSDVWQELVDQLEGPPAPGVAGGSVAAKPVGGDAEDGESDVIDAVLNILNSRARAASEGAGTDGVQGQVGGGGNAGLAGGQGGVGSRGAGVGTPVGSDLKGPGGSTPLVGLAQKQLPAGGSAGNGRDVDGDGDGSNRGNDDYDGDDDREGTGLWGSGDKAGGVRAGTPAGWGMKRDDVRQGSTSTGMQQGGLAWQRPQGQPDEGLDRAGEMEGGEWRRVGDIRGEVASEEAIKPWRQKPREDGGSGGGGYGRQFSDGFSGGDGRRGSGGAKGPHGPSSSSRGGGASAVGDPLGRSLREELEQLAREMKGALQHAQREVRSPSHRARKRSSKELAAALRELQRLKLPKEALKVVLGLGGGGGRSSGGGKSSSTSGGAHAHGASGRVSTGSGSGARRSGGSQSGSSSRGDDRWGGGNTGQGGTRGRVSGGAAGQGDGGSHYDRDARGTGMRRGKEGPGLGQDRGYAGGSRRDATAGPHGREHAGGGVGKTERHIQKRVYDPMEEYNQLVNSFTRGRNGAIEERDDNDR
eukprot:jgi/Mesvir1/18482/Mv14328-RA.2